MITIPIKIILSFNNSKNNHYWVQDYPNIQKILTKILIACRMIIVSNS